jgi:cytoskeleton protein RodZ
MSGSDVPVQMGLIDGPGAILLRAREAKGLGIADIAAMLHLSESKIKAIESDDFDSLPEPVFVRGYLMNYARLLEEPVDRVLAAYSKCGSKIEPPEQKLVESETEVEVSNNPDLVKIITIGVVAALILIPLVWWWNDLGQALQKLVASKEAYQSEITISPAASDSSDASQSNLTLPPAKSDDSDELNASETIALPELPKFEDVDQPLVENSDGDERIKDTINPKPEKNSEEVAALKELELPESIIKPITEPQESVVEEAKPEPKPVKKPEPEPKPKPVVTKSITAPVTKTIPIPAPKPVAAQQGVWFKFVESGWVKVRDAKNRVILIGEHNKGAIKKLGSVMPYKVVIGNSKAVKVEINGKVVDISSYSSGGVARFTIDNGKIGKP